MDHIVARTEQIGNFINLMELACDPVETNRDELEYLCRERSKSSLFTLWYYLIVFDSEENAVFPQTPFTALYSDEEEPQRHIKAIYEYNKLNGYSVLSLYEKNKWESVAEEIRILV